MTLLYSRPELRRGLQCDPQKEDRRSEEPHWTEDSGVAATT